MQCYSELLPPSGVTDSLRASFTSGTAENLIVARTSVLQIFDFCVPDDGHEARLILHAEYNLQGTISALSKVKLLTSKSGGDALLIAFRDAKLSLVEWSPLNHSISTVSIHYYENQDLLLCPWSPDLQNCVNHLAIEPSSKCAAFNFNVSSLAIIPFHQPNDDLALDDDFNDGLDSDNQTQRDNAQAPGLVSDQKPYTPSFVLSMSRLDPNLHHPISMAFLHEYRNPTLGVLFAVSANSMNMEPERKDVVRFAVYNLDIEHGSSTELLSVTKLPNDLHQAIAVPGPIGGTLLVGGNEIVHIDQSGKTNALAVNEFSRSFTSLPMADQSSLQLRLEDCRVLLLDGTDKDMLFVLRDGSLMALSFRRDGRSVAGLSLEPVLAMHDSSLLKASCTTVTQLSQGHLFIGSEEADSLLLSTEHKPTQLKRMTSRLYLDDTNGAPNIDDEIEEQDEDEGDEDDDDIYGNADAAPKNQSSVVDGHNFVLKQKLPVLAPLGDIVMGKSAQVEQTETSGSEISSVGDDADLQLLASCNGGAGGSLAFLSRTLKPRIVKQYQYGGATAVWAVSSDIAELEDGTRPFDDSLVVSKLSLGSSRRSALLSLASNIEEKISTNFDTNNPVVATGKLATGSHIVVYSKDVRTYNSDFGLDQIFAVVDDDDMDASDDEQKSEDGDDSHGTSLHVVSASITDTHVLLRKSDATLTLLKTDRSGDLDEIELPAVVPTSDIMSATIFVDEIDFFDTKRYQAGSTGTRCLLLAILTKDGGLTLHSLYNLEINVFNYRGLDYLPQFLASDLSIPKHWRTKEELVELSLCALGPHGYTKPYLLVRTKLSDVTIYEPYLTPEVKGSYRFTKLTCHNGDPRETYNDQGLEKPVDDQARIQPMSDLNGQSVAFVAGFRSKLIAKPMASMPVIHTLAVGPVHHFSAFHDSSCNRGFLATALNGNILFCELPAETHLEFDGWTVNRVKFEEEVTSVAYYPRTSSYIVATAKKVPFHLPRDDEWHPEWEAEHEQATANFLPTTQAYTLKLISSRTHSVISSYHFGADEQVLSIKCMNLEVSEQTHERKDLIVVGTGIARGENVVTRGNLYLFDVVDVVPHEDIPETDLKLKLVTKEDVRGAVTAITSLGTQGFVLAAQGQKSMVRGLREDNAILPVAFMDMRYYVSVAKALTGTGLTILGDAFSGLWLVGYSEEPYKLQLLARDLENPACVAAEFLPQDRQLFILSSDGDGELRAMQYDPDNPKTERGSILLKRSTFNTGYFPTLMTLVPRMPTAYEALQSTSANVGDDSDSENDMDVETPKLETGQQILMATREGAIVAITPLSEAAYRRLNALQNVLMTQLEQPCGLNPRAYRAVESDGIGGRAMIDGQVVKRWLYQSSQHKNGLADRVGASIWELRTDMALVTGAGMDYF